MRAVLSTGGACMMSQMNARSTLASISAILVVACGGGPGGAGEPPTPDAEAPVLRGAYRLEATLQGIRNSKEIGGTLTFRDHEWVDFVSYYERTRAPAPCRYRVRGARIVTGCGGMGLTISQVDDGRLHVELTGSVTEEYETTECASWVTNNRGQRVSCERWDTVTRTRGIRARAEAYLIKEPPGG